MQKTLKIFIALCFLISCKTQTSPQTTNTDTKRHLMSTLTKFEETPTERRTTISQTQQPDDIINIDTIKPQDIEEALNFIKEALNQATSQGRKIDAEAKINELTKDLNQQQINTMLKNIITILKIKKNIDNLLTQNNKIEENFSQIKSWTEEITKNLETQVPVTINNYHKEIAKTIVENSSNDAIRHDIKKISTNSIKEIQDQLYLLTTIVKDIIQHLTLQEKKALSLLQTLLKAIALYTHKDFMKFIINIKLQGTREMIKNLAKAMQLKAEIDILATQIQDKKEAEQIKSQVNIAYINNYLATLHKPIITLHNFDETQKYITNLNPNDELEKIKDKAQKIKDEQPATQNSQDKKDDTTNP
ncbi:hypothetical protein BCD_1288 (plasmid) [Borrelia crocidurae DOU]|uniref:Antigen P35 n=1 Tax=Borrelia crocidurae DOU TaxID=1293575 RepID=W5SJR7_9SPIR|nr:hypothetical protein [Borrelia crocidurae]AHH07354.1 hypothetical protein BCD_1288 [Borrelia crocidurae DOU]